MPSVKPVLLLHGRVAFAYVKDVSITVFTIQRWTDAEVVQMLDETTFLGEHITASATISHFFGEMLGAHHRKLVVDWLAKERLTASPRNALLTDSAMMRGGLTAYAWLTQTETRAFEPTERAPMCAWVTRGLLANPEDVRRELEACYALLGRPLP